MKDGQLRAFFEIDRAPNGRSFSSRGQLEPTCGLTLANAFFHRLQSKRQPLEFTLGMFKGYFDASGDDHSQLLLVIAGFVSHDTAWAEWETEWRERLAEYKLKCFHNRELYSWDLGRKRRLMDDLSEIISHHVGYKFGVIVKNTDLNAGLSEAARRRWRIQAYGLAGRTIAREARIWAESWGGLMPTLVFEERRSWTGQS